MASFTPFDGEAGGDRGDHEHDARRRPAGERRLGEGQDRSGGKVPVGQAVTASDHMLVKKLGTVVSKAGPVPNVLGGD